MTDPRATDAENSGVQPHAVMGGPAADADRGFTVGRSSPARSPVGNGAAPTGQDRFAWLLTSLAFLALLSFFLPYTVEKMTYAVARGRQRARYDTAGEHLKNVALKDLSDAYQWVADRVGPSVVHINVASAAADIVVRRRGHPAWQHPPTSQGSGVIVDQEGYLVTNAHVIRGYNRIHVKLSDGRTVQADVVGVDQLTDVAVLKIAADNLIAAKWGDSDDLEVGAMVWAMGSPVGLQRSVTFGILSGKNRTFSRGEISGMMEAQGVDTDSPYNSFLQTDAAVNPGNSGGPLVDSEGRIVGINTAIVGEAYQGISFAIPSSLARQIYERIRGEGRVTRGFLGVRPTDITMEEAKRLGLPNTLGALVVLVEPKRLDGVASPAQAAGIVVDDVVVQWDGKPVRNSLDLFSLVALTPVGTTVDVLLIRNAQQIKVQVTVIERPLSDG